MLSVKNELLTKIVKVLFNFHDVILFVLQMQVLVLHEVVNQIRYHCDSLLFCIIEDVVLQEELTVEGLTSRADLLFIEGFLQEVVLPDFVQLNPLLWVFSCCLQNEVFET